MAEYHNIGFILGQILAAFIFVAFLRIVLGLAFFTFRWLGPGVVLVLVLVTLFGGHS